MRKTLRFAALGLLACCMTLGVTVQSQAQGPVTFPADLQPGDQYRVFFVTDSTTRPFHPLYAELPEGELGVDYYNRHVSSDANAQPELEALGTTWKAVVSVRDSLSGGALTRARDNTDTDPTPAGPTGVPIYLLNGTRLADNYDDLWDGSVQNPPSIARNGAARPGTDTRVWTGTLYNGSQMYAFGFGAWSWGEYDKTEHTIPHSSPWGPTLLGGPFFVNGTNNGNVAVALPLYGISGILTVPVENDSPIANAGENQSIRAGDIVYLDGIASFDDNTASADLEYAWLIFSQPDGSTAALDDPASVMPTFVADVAGDYVLALVVTDEGGLASEPAFVTISSDNLAPTAVATSNVTLAVVGDVVDLDGSDSFDPEDDDIAYTWTIVAAPAGSTAALVGADTASPTLIPDLEGVYEISLFVSDFLGAGLPATVEFTATTAESFAELLILDACEIVEGLNAWQVTTKGNQNAFCKHLANAVKDLQDGLTADAIDKLNKAIERTDGCPLRGTPDGNGKGRDWIIDCDAQEVVYDLLTQAVEILE